MNQNKPNFDTLMYCHKDICNKLIYMYYSKFMERIGLDCYGKISIFNYDEFINKSLIDTTDDFCWRALIQYEIINNYKQLQNIVIVYDINNVIRSFMDITDWEGNIFSINFFIAFITGLYHELTHVKQFLDNRLNNETIKECETEAEEFTDKMVLYLLNDRYELEILNSLIRNYSLLMNNNNIVYLNSNPPITRNVKGDDNSEI